MPGEGVGSIPVEELPRIAADLKSRGWISAWISACGLSPLPKLDREKVFSHLHAALGHRRLSRTWAKIEILLGLFAAGLGNWVLGQGRDFPWLFVPSGLGLFILGDYLALAGHRSHLYQSNNELVAYLVEEIRSIRGVPPENQGSRARPGRDGGIGPQGCPETFGTNAEAVGNSSFSVGALT